ncbi:MAG: HEPN domain-containing protein [Lachnospiraceae bacterium]|nr:HEPN domain-containing protein [Lachnospiraceae bacterium]
MYQLLLNQIRNKVCIEDKYYDYVDTLTLYGVLIRYPNELFLEERHAKEAFEFSDEILNWVQRILCYLQ